MIFVFLFNFSFIFAPAEGYVCTHSNSGPIETCSDTICPSPWEYTDVGCGYPNDEFYCPETGETYCSGHDCGSGGDTCYYTYPFADTMSDSFLSPKWVTGSGYIK